MTQPELPKAYDFKSTEPRIYAMWEAGGFFKPSNDPNQPDFDPSVKPFVISIPPPNVTGELHLGNARTALFNALLARHAGGDFLLRIEDTDAARSTPGHAQQLQQDLRWLGLHWAGEVLHQSQRLGACRGQRS